MKSPEDLLGSPHDAIRHRALRVKTRGADNDAVGSAGVRTAVVDDIEVIVH